MTTSCLCKVCFNQPAVDGIRCPDCLPPAQPPPRKRRTPKPVDISQGLPENLAGYSLEDFLP